VADTNPICITEGQRRWHLFGEWAAMFVAVPFSAYIATRKQLPVWARATAGTIGVVTFVLDLTSIIRYSREFRPPESGGFGDAMRDVLVAYLQERPGLVSHGLVLQNPGAPRSKQRYAYEVRWLRDEVAPPLPREVGGYPVKLVYVDDFPIAYES
jgi:hypothetical protein